MCHTSLSTCMKKEHECCFSLPYTRLAVLQAPRILLSPVLLFLHETWDYRSCDVRLFRVSGEFKHRSSGFYNNRFNHLAHLSSQGNDSLKAQIITHRLCHLLQDLHKFG